MPSPFRNTAIDFAKPLSQFSSVISFPSRVNQAISGRGGPEGGRPTGGPGNQLGRRNTACRRRKPIKRLTNARNESSDAGQSTQDDSLRAFVSRLIGLR